MLFWRLSDGGVGCSQTPLSDAAADAVGRTTNVVQAGVCALLRLRAPPSLTDTLRAAASLLCAAAGVLPRRRRERSFAAESSGGFATAANWAPAALAANAAALMPAVVSSSHAVCEASAAAELPPARPPPLPPLDGEKKEAIEARRPADVTAPALTLGVVPARAAGAASRARGEAALLPGAGVTWVGRNAVARYNGEPRAPL